MRGMLPWGMQNNKHGHDREMLACTRSVSLLVLVCALAAAPVAQADNYYLARAIGEPPALHHRPLRDPAPDLPGLGAEARTTTPPPSAGSNTTWKWVVGIALTAAVVALAKGGDKGGGDSAPSSTGGGGSGGDSGGSGGGNRPPRLPDLPDLDD